MKEIDDTEIEIELTLGVLKSAIEDLRRKVRFMTKRIANLETQRTPADANMDDPEWY